MTNDLNRVEHNGQNATLIHPRQQRGTAVRDSAVIPRAVAWSR
jgi:hypothetical protein